MNTPHVIVYTTTWCAFCKMAKNYLLQLGVPFTEKDVEHEPVAGREAVDKSGQRGVPVIDIQGTIILGFDKAAIDHGLKKHDLLKE